jgi:Ca-activated chloride channel family protein
LLKRFFYIVSVLLIHTITAAQQFYMKGEVMDEAGNYLQNVTIFQHSTGYIFHTGMSGGFGIITKQKTDTLTFSQPGFQEQKTVADAAAYLTITLKKEVKGSGNRLKLSSLTENLQREIQQQWFLGDETYASIIENQFINTSAYPSTGVTLNVDRASYSNIRRLLKMNTPVPPDAVRIEEMLNYFNFNYTEPANNKTFEINSTLTQCPWNMENELLFVNIKSRKILPDSLPPTHLVFLIDVSGSMDMPNRLPLLKQSFRGLVNNLRAKDSVSIVVYGGTVGIALNTTSGAEKEKIFHTIDSLTPGGSTPGESGIKLAYSIARLHFIKNGNNRVILATDGDFNVGIQKESDLEDLIISQKKTGIYLTCLGVGMGNYKDSKIQALAQKGEGNFAYIDSYAEAEKVLMKEFMQTLYTVADDAYLKVKFNPDYVKKYRLVGFDNKVGAIKDTLSVIEGGAIGSAFSMLIAFELVPANEEIKNAGKWQQPVSFSLKYKLPGKSTTLEEMQQPEVALIPLESISRSYRFAASVIMFGLQLRESKFIKNVSWSEIESLATQSADKDNSSQNEFLTLVHLAKSIYTKKRKRGE